METIKNRGSILSRKQRKYIFAALFSAPATIIYTLFVLVPLVGVLIISLHRWTGAGSMLFIGVTNFRTLFAANSTIYQVLYNSFVLIALTVFLQIPIALVLSFMLYRSKRGSNFFRTVYFLPAVIAATCIALMFTIMLNGDMGPVNGFLRARGWDFLARNWLADPSLALYTVSFITIWQYLGYRVTLIMAGMSTIPDEIVESAIIDGASSVQLFLHIVLPLIKSVLKVTIIFGVAGSLRHFEHAFVMTWGGPGLSSTFLNIHMWKTAYLRGDLGLATAIAALIVFLAVVCHKALDVFIKED